MILSAAMSDLKTVFWQWATIPLPQAGVDEPIFEKKFKVIMIG